jgi:hypothetical protein
MATTMVCADLSGQCPAVFTTQDGEHALVAGPPDGH